MFSLTLSKLAVDSDIQKRILKGSIVLVSHNFSLDNSNILKVAQEQDIGSDKISLLTESMGLVHRIQSNLRDIHRIQVHLPNRKCIPVRNIHILHEHLSLGTHGYTPETDFARISNLIDLNRGTAFLDSQYEPEHHRGTDAYNESDESWTQRYKGVMISRKYFTYKGFTQLNFEQYLSPKFVRKLKKFWRHRYDYPFSDAYRYQVFSADKSHINEVIQSNTPEIVSDET